MDVTEAVDFLRECQDADSNIRDLALKDLRFRWGDQWPKYAIASRGLDRPQLVINETDSYIRQITNNQRQQRPRIKVHAVDNFADPKIAQVIEGLIRHIQVNSDADNAYDIAFDFAATMGFGYWRLRTDYISETSFDQEIYIDSVDNPFTVYFDPHSRLPDGSDAEKCLVTDFMAKSAFEKEFGNDAYTGGFTGRGTGDSDGMWVNKDDIRVAEYFWVERKPAKLVMLSDGMAIFEDELPPAALLEKAGIHIIGERDSFKRVVKWQKQTAYDILEEKNLPGKWIPVIPMYWTNTIIENEKRIQGLVRPAMDSQRMINFWQTAITESLALAPKPKWLLADGQDEGHEKEWASANLSANAILRYKTTDVDGNPAPPPQRIAPAMPPEGFMAGGTIASMNLQRVMGMYDPATRAQMEKSGTALNAEAQQSDMSNFNGYDNLTRSLKHTGRILLSYIPVIYDTQRVMRIIGDDGKSKQAIINDKSTVDRVLNDVTVGTYDVVMETGPGYDSKRQEGVEAMIGLMSTPIGEQVAQAGSDILVRQIDAPMMDVLADRLKAMNPLAQIDEESDIPPQIQMMIKQMQQTIQQQGQQLQQQEIMDKFKFGQTHMKEQAETEREQMRIAAKLHDTQERSNTYQHDVETRAMTQLNVEEIRGLVTLLAKQLDISTFKKEVEEEEREEQQKFAEEA